ncbi:hypothetical protein BJV82DRAFT_664441 [Fennellomyces sp. T-0311]|nr:hypothetical protein BJV82DRAFT_664441 [Fennellomyces sp. T-0311]
MSFMSTTTYFDAPGSVIYGYGPLIFVVRQGTCNVIDQQRYDDAVHELGADVRDFEAMLSSDDEDEPLVGRTKPRNEHQELEPVANDKGKDKTATEKKAWSSREGGQNGEDGNGRRSTSTKQTLQESHC